MASLEVWDEAVPPDRVIDGLARYGMQPWEFSHANHVALFTEHWDRFVRPLPEPTREEIKRLRVDLDHPLWGR